MSSEELDAGQELPTGLEPRELALAVGLLERLCAESSSSGDAPGLARAARTIARELEARGFAGEPAGNPPVLIARSRSTGRKPLLLIGHFDTVLEATRPRRDGPRLFATGAIDMKGGIATLLAALDHLHSRGRETPDDLLVVLVPDEEVAGTVSRRATAEHGAAARACFVLEPGERRDGAETIVVGRRGMAIFRLDVHGRAAHSGLAFHQGRSAVAAAGAWITAAAALSRAGGGPTVNLSRVLGGERELVEMPVTAATLFGSDRQLNVVPDRVRIEGEYRYLDPSDGELVHARLTELAEEIGAATEVRFELSFGGSLAPVAPTPERLASAERAVALAARRGWALEVERDRGGISFPNFLPPGIALPVLDGLGPAGGGMHTREEFVELRSFARRIALLADLLEAEAST